MSPKNPLEASRRVQKAIWSGDWRKKQEFAAHDHFSWKALSVETPNIEDTDVDAQSESSDTQESAQTYHTDNSYTDNSWFYDGWSYGEWNGDWVGWDEGWEQTHDNSASPLSLGSSDLGAMSGPKRLEWAKMNLDTGEGVNASPSNFGPDGAGDGI